MDSFPHVIRLEPIGICNFKCLHCTTGRSPNNRPTLTVQNFRDLLINFKYNNYIPDTVALYHGGEPLMNKKLEYFILELKNIGVNKTVFNTNASLLNQIRSEKIISAGIDEVRFSFDGMSPTENDEMRLQGNFFRDAGNVINFLKIRDQVAKNVNVIIDTTLILDKKLMTNFYNSKKLYLDDSPAYIKNYFSGFNVDYRCTPALMWPGMRSVDTPYTICEYSNSQPSYCSALFETFTVISNGGVVPCCFDLQGEVVFGNAFEEDIIAIWNNRKFIDFRNNFKNNTYSNLCNKCSVVNPRYIIKNKDKSH